MANLMPLEIFLLKMVKVLEKEQKQFSVDSGGGLSVWSLDVAHLSFLPPNKDKDLPTGLKMWNIVLLNFIISGI